MKKSYPKTSQNFLTILLLIMSISLVGQDEIEVSGNLLDATYLMGSSNPSPTGPILRAEQGNREIYLKFDIGTIENTITAAQLEMQVASDPGNGKLEVFLASNSNWTETGLNGSNKPAAVGNAIASISGTHNLGQTKIWNLDVSQLANGGLITLIVKHSNGNDVAFASDESENAPELNITTSPIEEELRPFITTWKTDNQGASEDNQITIPTREGEIYNYKVEWGDGTSDSGVMGDITHSYANPGTYQVSISGDFPSILFNDPFNNGSGDGDKILSIDQWGDISWEYLSVAFAGCDNLDIKATDVPDFSKLEFANAMFHSCTSLVGNESIGLWNFDSAISMVSMFYNAPLFNQDIGQWNVSNVSNFTLMFGEATSFNQNISGWDVSNAENMNGMFAGATSFDQDLGNWNISNISNISNLGGFFDRVTLSSENYDALLNAWSTQQVQNDLLFDAGNSQYCQGEEARQKLIDDFGWTITDGGKASDCADTTSFITTWKTDNSGASEDNQITIPTFPGEIYNYSVNWGDGNSDSQVNGNITHTYETSGTYQVSISGDFPRIYFNDDDGSDDIAPDWRKLVLVNQWGDIPWSSMGSAFYSCLNLDIVAEDTPDLSRVTDMSNMLNNCHSLVGTPVFNDWDVSNVINMGAALASALVFDQDISNWNTSSVTTMAAMFFNTSFNQDISSWNTSSVQDMTLMFESATAFDQDISNWDVSSVGDMLNMFNGITLSIENYDALLNRWSTQALQTNVDFSAGNSRYCQGEEARQKLIDDFGWTITDEGKLEDCDSVEAPADLVAATFLEGSRNPLPTGPILRAEQGNREIYLKYDLSSFGSSIAEATLQMQIASDPGNGTLQVFLGSNSNWTETGLNGSNKPAAVGNALASISGTHSLGQIKTWNLDASRLTGGGEITLIVKHSNGNDVAFASDETNQAPQLSISSGGVLVPKINSISFVNARKTIELYDGIRFESAAEYCDFALIPYVFRAETHESVKSVEFTLTGPNNFTAVSNDSPFALFDSDIDASPPLSDGDYVLFATAYTEPSAQGLNSEVYEVTFVVRNGCDEAKENTYIEVFNASSCESSDGIAILRGELGAPFDGPSDENWVYDTELQAYKSVDLSPGSYSVLAGGPNCAAIYEFVIEADNCPETNETADLIDATYLEGTRNPLPTGPILRAEQGNREVYMKFDLSAFSGSISEAELQMQVASDPGNGILEVFQGSNSNWTEIGLNGSNKPVAVGNALASISGTHSLGQTKTWNLDVSQITGGGLITLIVKHSSGNDVAFASDETNQAPKLIITSEDVGADTLNSLSLSPNPASVDIAVGFEEPRQVGAIFVYDVSGKLVHAVPAGEVKSEGNYQMNVSSLPSGMYFVRTFDADGIPHQKAMVIEH